MKPLLRTIEKRAEELGWRRLRMEVHARLLCDPPSQILIRFRGRLRDQEDLLSSFTDSVIVKIRGIAEI